MILDNQGLFYFKEVPVPKYVLYMIQFKLFRNRKNVITLSGQVTSFIVEFLTSMIYLAQIFYHDLADPSHQPILLIFASTIISCVQLGSSHELKRFVKSLIEKWKKKVVFEFILAKYVTDLYNILAWLNTNFNYDFFLRT